MKITEKTLLIALTLIFGTIAFAQKPSPFAPQAQAAQQQPQAQEAPPAEPPPAVQPAPAEKQPDAAPPEPAVRESLAPRNLELFPEDLARVKQSDVEWRRLDDELDGKLAAMVSCSAEPSQAIHSTADAKLQSLTYYAAYYQKHLQRWQEVARLAQTTSSGRMAGRNELVGAAQMEEREMTDLQRRIGELEQVLKDKKLNSDQKALRELKAMAEKKKEQVEKQQAVVKLFDEGQQNLEARRDLARTRVNEINELLHGIKTETMLWEHLYKGMSYRQDLKCDKEVPKPEHFPSDWRDRIKNRTAAAAPASLEQQ